MPGPDQPASDRSLRGSADGTLRRGLGELPDDEHTEYTVHRTHSVYVPPATLNPRQGLGEITM